MKRNSLYITNQYILLLFLSFVLLLVVGNGHTGGDEGSWGYIGRVWSENNLPPYVGTVENKTPGIFELFALSNILFGVNVFFVRIIGGIAILITSLTVYSIGKKLHSHFAGIFSMAIFGLTMSWYLLNGPETAQTETFMVLFSTVSFYFVVKGKESLKWMLWIFLSGLSIGFAIAFKQIALTSAAALSIFFLLYFESIVTNSKKIAGLLILGSGAVVATFISVIPLLLSHVSLTDYFNGAWLILLKPGSSAPAMLRVEECLNIFLNSRLVVFYPFIGLIIWQSELLKNKYFMGLMVWLLFDFVGVNASGYYYGHQIKQLIPSLAVIIGIGLSNALSQQSREKSEMPSYAAVMVLFIIVLFFPYQQVITNGYKATRGYVDDKKELGIWLKEHTNKNDYVYIDSRDGIILSYSERVSSSKYFDMIFVTSTIESDQLLSDLENKPPRYYITPSIDGSSKIGKYILGNYDLLLTKETDEQVYKVFQHKAE